MVIEYVISIIKKRVSSTHCNRNCDYPNAIPEFERPEIIVSYLVAF